MPHDHPTDDPSVRANPSTGLRVLVAALLALSTLLVLAAVAAVQAERRADGREAARSVVLSAEPRSSDVFLRLTQDFWQGHRIQVAFLAPAGDASAAVLPPGVDRLPAPGQAVVSPALDALAREHAGLAALYPDRRVLGDMGVATSEELVAYVRPAAGRGLGGEDGALRLADGTVTGDRITARIGGFGGTTGLPVFDDEPAPAWRTPLLAAALGLLPALLLLLLGLGRATRPRRSWRATLALAAPGPALAVAGWLLADLRTADVPLTGLPGAPGGAALPAPVLLLTLAAYAVAAVLLATLLARLPRRDRSGARDRSWSASTQLRLLPLAAGAVLLVVGTLTGLGDRLPVVALASLLCLVGVAAVLPPLLAEVGRRLATSPRAVVQDAGRDLQQGGPAARPFRWVALGVLAALSLVPLTASASATAPVATDLGGASAVSVEWVDVADGDLARLQRELGSGLAVPVEAGGHDHDHDDDHGQEASAGHDHAQEGPVLLGATCPQLARAVPLQCVAGQPLALGADDRARLARLVGTAVAVPDDRLRLAGPTGVPDGGSAVVLGPGGLSALDAATRAAAREALPGALVASPVFEVYPDLTDQRALDSAAVRLALLLLLATLVLAVDGLLARRRTASRGSLAVRFLAGWWTAAGLALVIGYLARLQTAAVDQRADLGAWTATLVAALVVGSLLGLAAVAGAGRAGAGRVAAASGRAA